MSTLYRKYRPQKFADAVGQNHVKITLQNEIRSGKVAHAYLFCGPRGVGKTTISRLFAKAVNCINRKDGEYEPCNECDICKEITAGKSLDISEIDAASHTGVDNVRENIISSVNVSPSRCKYKIFIIDEVHMLSISAFNALLKTMEEPPANVIFILCTTEVHKIPATIISRCQRFDFKRIGVSDMVDRLKYVTDKEEIKIEKSILEAIARYSGGYMRDAESLLGQILSISGKEISQKDVDLVIPKSNLGEVIKLIKYLSKKDCVSGIRLINDLLDGGVDLNKFTNDLIEVLRKTMINKINPGLADKLGLDLGESLELEFEKASEGLEVDRLVFFIEKFLEVRKMLKNSHLPQLPLELAVAEICSGKAVVIEKVRDNRGEIADSSDGIKERVEQVSSSSRVDNYQGRKEYNIAEQKKVDNIKSGKEESSQITNEKVEQAKKINDNTNFNKNDIIKKWPEFLNFTKKSNHSLSFILKACQPGNLEGNKLTLIFKYKFHKDRINTPQIKQIVEKALSDVYGYNLSVEAVIDENLKIAPVEELGDDYSNTNEDESNIDKVEDNPNNEMINNLLNTFGGKVVK